MYRQPSKNGYYDKVAQPNQSLKLTEGAVDDFAARRYAEHNMISRYVRAMNHLAGAVRRSLFLSHFLAELRSVGTTEMITASSIELVAINLHYFTKGATYDRPSPILLSVLLPIRDYKFIAGTMGSIERTLLWRRCFLGGLQHKSLCRNRLWRRVSFHEQRHKLDSCQ